jgi:hypothetical protein
MKMNKLKALLASSFLITCVEASGWADEEMVRRLGDAYTTASVSQKTYLQCCAFDLNSIKDGVENRLRNYAYTIDMDLLDDPQKTIRHEIESQYKILDNKINRYLEEMVLREEITPFHAVMLAKYERKYKWNDELFQLSSSKSSKSAHHPHEPRLSNEDIAEIAIFSKEEEIKSEPRGRSRTSSMSYTNSDKQQPMGK